MGRPSAGYRNAAGNKIPSVTTIIGRFKDSGALLWWAYGQGQAAQRGEINSLYDKRDEAADAGTLAHQMVEEFLKGRPGPDLADVNPDTVTLAKQSFKNFRSWWEQTKIEIVHQETPLVSEKFQFGGTPDAVGRQGKTLILLDWKTSKGVYVDYLIQVAAYVEMWNENHPDEKIKGGAHLCRFSKDTGDFSHHYFKDLKGPWKAFRLMRELYELDKQLKKRV